MGSMRLPAERYAVSANAVVEMQSAAKYRRESTNRVDFMASFLLCMPLKASYQNGADGRVGYFDAELSSSSRDSERRSMFSQDSSGLDSEDSKSTSMFSRGSGRWAT